VSTREAAALTVARNDVYFRPRQPAYRRQLRAPVSAAARGRGPDTSLPRPGAVPHPPLVRAPCPSQCPAAGSGRDTVHGPVPEDCPVARSRSTGPWTGCRRRRHLRFHRPGQDV